MSGAPGAEGDVVSMMMAKAGEGLLSKSTTSIKVMDAQKNDYWHVID